MNFVKENSAKCDWEVVSLTMTREGYFSHKFVGFATLKVEDINVNVNLTAYDDGNSA